MLRSRKQNPDQHEKFYFEAWLDMVNEFHVEHMHGDIWERHNLSLFSCLVMNSIFSIFITFSNENILEFFKRRFALKFRVIKHFFSISFVTRQLKSHKMCFQNLFQATVR